MANLAAKPGFTAGFVGLAFPLPLLLLRLVATADLNYVYFLGRELHWGCWFKERFGFPCPGCGMTRSVVLAVHGNFGAAWQMNPTGVLGATGLMLFSLTMLWLMFQQRRGQDTAGLERKIRVSVTVAGLGLIAFWAIEWLTRVS
jgi:hypothetical protein